MMINELTSCSYILAAAAAAAMLSGPNAPAELHIPSPYGWIRGLWYGFESSDKRVVSLLSRVKIGGGTRVCAWVNKLVIS